PSCAALGGLVLATLVLKEKLPTSRAAGALVIVAGLAVIGADALATIGTHGLIGDLSFVTAGLMFAAFATLLRLWRIAPMRAVASVVSLVDAAIQWLAFSFERMIAMGLTENLVQFAVHGIFAGAAATYLFTRSVVLLGGGRAAVFPSLVPGFTLLIGFLTLGEVPSLAQLAGFAIVLRGFRLTQKSLTRNPAHWVPHFRLSLMQKCAAHSLYSPPPRGEGLWWGSLSGSPPDPHAGATQPSLRRLRKLACVRRPSPQGGG